MKRNEICFSRLERRESNLWKKGGTETKVVFINLNIYVFNRCWCSLTRKKLRDHGIQGPNWADAPNNINWNTEHQKFAQLCFDCVAPHYHLAYKCIMRFSRNSGSARGVSTSFFSIQSVLNPMWFAELLKVWMDIYEKIMAPEPYAREG